MFHKEDAVLEGFFFVTKIMWRLVVADAAGKTRATNPERRVGGIGVAVGHQQWCGLYRGVEGEIGSGGMAED